MRFYLYFISFCFLSPFPTFADQPKETKTERFSPFTGKITRNKVRLRLQPGLDGHIIKELSKDDLLTIIGEEDEFYAVQPPTGFKAYVFRTYVLDNEIEGDRVNVRLEPDTNSPIIGQLNRGDRVDGIISPLNSKWLEISPPKNSKFFICKEFVENIGDSSMLAVIERRQEEAGSLLTFTEMLVEAEFQKPFETIDIETIKNNLSKIQELYSDFPRQTKKAKELLAAVQNDYLQRKIAYLESKTLLNEPQNTPPSQTNTYQTEIQRTDVKADNMAAWEAAERTLFKKWQVEHPSGSMEDYYAEQEQASTTLTGKIEANNRLIKNKPGDFVLINNKTNLPIAYLYSSKVNLNDAKGRTVTLKASPRPNNHFAFPAYFVHEIK